MPHSSIPSFLVSKYVIIVVVISRADLIVANYILDIHFSRALLLLVAVGYIHGDKKSISLRLIHNYCLLLLLELKMPKLMTEVPLLQVLLKRSTSNSVTFIFCIVDNIWCILGSNHTTRTASYIQFQQCLFVVMWVYR